MNYVNFVKPNAQHIPGNMVHLGEKLEAVPDTEDKQNHV